MPTYYVIDDKKCFHESMAKEEILTAIVQAQTEGRIINVDTGFITTIKEQNRNVALKFWRGTVAEYNALTNIDPTTHYIITDDSTVSDLSAQVAQNTSNIQSADNALSEMMYEPSDTTQTVIFHGAGHLTGGGNSLLFSVPLPKFLRTNYETAYGQNACSISIVVRQNGSYIVGSANQFQEIGGSATVTNCGNYLLIEARVTTSGATNNDAVGIQGTIQFKVVESE